MTIQITEEIEDENDVPRQTQPHQTQLLLILFIDLLTKNRAIRHNRWIKMEHPV